MYDIRSEERENQNGDTHFTSPGPFERLSTSCHPHFLWDSDELAMRDCRKSVPTRCPTHRKPPRPPEKPPLRLAPLSTFILLFIALLSLLHPTHGLAQETTSHSSSSNPSPSAISTISISGLPSLLTLPPLNSTAPTIQLDLPTTSSLYITLNICSLGANTSLIPSVLLSTASPTVFNLGTRPSADRESGGVGRANRRSRAGTTWLLEWDMGFANWTSTGEEVGVAVFLGMGLRVDGSVDGSVLGQGNVVVQIGIAGDGTSALRSLIINMTILSPTSPAALPLSRRPAARRHNLHLPPPLLPSSPLLSPSPAFLPKLHPAPSSALPPNLPIPPIQPDLPLNQSLPHPRAHHFLANPRRARQQLVRSPVCELIDRSSGRSEAYVCERHDELDERRRGRGVSHHVGRGGVVGGDELYGLDRG